MSEENDATSGGTTPPEAPRREPLVKDDAPLDGLLHNRRRARVKVVRKATVQVAVEMTSDEITDIRSWLQDHERSGTQPGYVEGDGVPLPDALVQLLQAVTD